MGNALNRDEFDFNMEDGGGLIKREPYEFVEGNITPQGSDIHFQE